MSLEGYDLERADFARVLNGARKIASASTAELQSVDWLVEMIREVGLVPIPEAEITYEGEQDFINGTQQGLIQVPREFACWLTTLGEQKPSSYLEIGCFNGATATIAFIAPRRALMRWNSVRR